MRPSKFRLLLAETVALSAAILLLIVVSPPAVAHCPDSGHNGHRYVAGGNGSNTVRSVSTAIGWLSSPNVCNSGTSYSISITRGLGGSDPGWIQVGWRYYAGYSRPMGYCERRPRSSGNGSYALTEYIVPQQAQRYAYVKNNDEQFECRINGDVKRITHQDFLGFVNGDWVPVQAEAHARHLQLGRIASNWLNFSEADRVLAGETAWSQMNVIGVGSDAPVWNFKQPDNDGFAVNTDADH